MRTKTTRKKKRRKRTTIGAKLVAPLLLLLLALSPVLPGGDKHAESAVVAGTVFRDPGFAMPGATVALTVKTKPEGVKPPKAQKTSSDARGEFAFYVPPRKAQYLVTVTARGYVQQEKVVEVNDSPDRMDVYFQLKPETTPQQK